MVRPAFIALVLVALASTSACAGLQNWTESVEQSAAINACNEAGWTKATGRHQECSINTRAAMAQQQQQELAEILVGGAAVAAASNLYRTPAQSGLQGLRRAPLVGQDYENYQSICRYQTESGIVQVVSRGTCAPEYFY